MTTRAGRELSSWAKSQVKSAAELAALPEGSKISFPGKHTVFILTKRNEIWTDSRMSVTSVELESIIENVTHGKRAMVVP